MKKLNLLTLKVLVLLTIPILTNDLFSQGFIWEKIGPDSISYVNDIECSGASEVLVAATPGLIYYSSNSGEDWIIRNEGLQPNRSVDFIAKDSRGNFYCTNGSDVYKSGNHGESWFVISVSIPDDGFGFLFVAENDFIFVRSILGLYKSEDYGNSWAQTDFLIDAGPSTMVSEGDIFYAGSPNINGGLFKSTDYGNTWNRPSHLPLKSLCSLGNGDLFGVHDWIDGDMAVIYGNYGDTIKYQYLLDCGSAWDSAIRDRDGRLYLTNNFNGNYYSGVICSSDNGLNWENAGALLRTNVRNIAIDSSGFIYAYVHYYGIYRHAGPTIPIELVNFSCSVVGGKVLLNWKTATETNNFGFEIEREAANNSWSKIAFVEGHGTTTREHAYQFEDNPGPGIFRYRLKQIDPGWKL